MYVTQQNPDPNPSPGLSCKVNYVVCHTPCLFMFMLVVPLEIP